MNFKEMLIKISEKKLQWYLFSFVCEGKEEIHKYVQYEVSMTACVGRIANQSKVPKWLAFKSYKSKLPNI